MNNKLVLDLKVRDLLARMYWKDAPRTIAIADTNTKQFDADGFVIFNPAISGLEINEDFIQKLPRKIYFSSSYEIDRRFLIFEYNDFKVKKFYSLGAGYGFIEGDKVTALYNVTASAIKISYATEHLSIYMLSDKLNLDEARTFGLFVSGRYDF